MRIYDLRCYPAYRAFIAKKSDTCEDMGWSVQ